MRKLFEQFLVWWDAWSAPRVRFRNYNVTPRQGRYVIGRKLLRQLERRIDLPIQPSPHSFSCAMIKRLKYAG